MMVRAEIKKSLQYGLVLGETVLRPEGPVKEIAEVFPEGPIVGGNFLNLLKWIAEYYIASEGAALKTAALLEFCRPSKTPRKARRKKEPPPPSDTLSLPVASPRIIAPIRASLATHQYRTYLFHAPTISHEISCLLAVMEGCRNVIILAPELKDVEVLTPLLAGACGDRLAVLHGRLSKSQRRAAIGRILTGDADVVLGTRIAVTAPLPSVSLIAVLQEQNQSYKNLEGVRYHARDVAVMRGYIEKATVLLSSHVPSVESFHNSEKSKYILLASDAVARPRIEIIDMKTAGRMTPHFSRSALQAASSAIKSRESVLFLLNRKGYSLIQCSECSTVFTCPDCNIPLIYHKTTMNLRCHYCGRTSRAPDLCTKCGSMRLDTVGAGTQRIAADIRKHLHVEPLRIDRDALRDRPLNGLPDTLRGDEFIVGTKAIKGQLGARASHRLCVFLNPDIGLHIPDFRSSELIFQEIIGMTEYVRKDGLIIVQTKMPENHAFRYARGYRFREFYREELATRSSLAYPPFSRMITMTFSSDRDLRDTVMNAFSRPGDAIECIGPIPVPRQRGNASKVILRSASREKLGRYARSVLEGLKGEKRLRIVVDVDPIQL
jgi:primosomal protein N' (replication factor Y)